MDVDQIPPSEVYGLSIIHGENEVCLSWKDPRNFDFRNIRVECADSVYVVAKGVQKINILNLKSDTTYTIYIKTVDYSGNKSPGTRVFGKPKSLPHLEWGTAAEMHMEYSPQGYPNGRFYVQRNFTNNGNAGYISFQIYTIDLIPNDTVNFSQKLLLLEANTSYIFHYSGIGDLTIFNCSECDTVGPSHRIEFISELDHEIFYTHPINCQLITGCGNGINKRRIQWNSIATKGVYLEKTGSSKN